MPGNPEPTGLEAVIERLRAMGAVPALGRRLEADRAAAQAELRKTIVEQIPAFSETRNPEILPELAAHSARHVDEIARLLSGHPPGNFDFVAENARRRAEQRFPLEATLHAYRCGLRSMSTWMRANAPAGDGIDERQLADAAADFAIEYTDAISNLLTAEYVAQARQLAEAEGDRRTELMNILLGGYDESDGRVARILRRAGYLEQRQSYCVALAQPADAREMENPARARRLADAVAGALRRLVGRQLVGVRDAHVVAIVSDTRRLSGWTAPQTRLADRIYPELMRIGPAAVIGMSTDVPSTAHIPKAHGQAQVALDFAHAGDRVVRYAAIPVRQMVLRHARESVQPALPAWSDALARADAAANGALVATLRAYAAADMNVLGAAKALAVHANTVYGRLQRVEEITGHDARGYAALTELLLAIDCRL
ncbi:MAG TPA: helix-turn-helix domain-containing protein [Woeseiaceae bacterium]|nr:helix-turn-helix domain-containing protein [Woeseiaceae bacterium]